MTFTAPAGREGSVACALGWSGVETTGIVGSSPLPFDPHAAKLPATKDRKDQGYYPRRHTSSLG